MEYINHPQYDEKFLKEPSKVVDAIQFIDIMINSNKMEDTRGDKKKEVKPVVDISEGVTDKNFFISQRLLSGRMSAKRSKARMKFSTNTNQFTFMRQVDQSNEERVEARLERERIANNFRRLGNWAYRREQFSTAIDFYNKGLENICDTPVLYINRACCYLKLRSFKSAIIDCDYVLNKLDPKYMRAWLYRAAAFKRLNDEKNYEECVYQVKRLNSKEIQFINSFLEKMRTL
ncbi:tetratricopeptide repeat protein 12 [Drosophila novamexicana]|uniref:tetratricopeptide repeat protein 12 n=1 Tax=Drosophila novamexicana TaxID=47314 RepID=UPI0011E5C100|nr:tetratricopeptide repeat protein 12 [Drosophila novamexicana]